MPDQLPVIDLYELKTEPPWDVVIVGGGMAGLAVAAELERIAAVRVLVVEAGPGDDIQHYRSSGPVKAAIDKWLYPQTDEYFWRPWASADGSYLGLACLRRRLGGRSLYWHGVTLPIEPWALADARWPRSVVRDLTESFNGGPGLYARTEQRLAAWSHGPEAATLAQGTTITVGSHRFEPVPLAVRLQAEADPAHWSAYTPLEHWTEPNEGSTQTTSFLLGCRVVGVVIRNGAAAGVRVEHDGQVRDISAGRVILAGGTVENTRLATQDADGKPLPGSVSGTGLVDKIVHGFTVTFGIDRCPADLASAARLGAFHYRSCADELRSNMFLTLRMPDTETVVLDSWMMGEQDPHGPSAVHCDPVGEPPTGVVIASGLSDADRQLAKAQQGALHNLWDEVADAIGVDRSALEFDLEYGTAELSAILARSAGQGSELTPTTYSFPLGSEQHEAGTLPLGMVLDDDHQFVAVPGLYAAGPATFPRTGAANPTMTTLALAQRLAHRIAQ